MNWYAYCGNNSLNCSDPMGLYPVEVNIPLQTIWHEPFLKLSETVTLRDTSLVKAFLEDSNFKDYYPDVTLISGIYNVEKEEFHCIFDVPDDTEEFKNKYGNMRMEIKKVKGVPILYVTSGNRSTHQRKTIEILDWRLIGILSDPAYIRTNITPIGGYIAWGIGKAFLGVALWAIPGWPGKVLGTGFILWGVADFYKVVSMTSKEVPNFGVIKDIVETYGGYENIFGLYYRYKDYYHLK